MGPDIPEAPALAAGIGFMMGFVIGGGGSAVCLIKLSRIMAANLPSPSAPPFPQPPTGPAPLPESGTSPPPLPGMGEAPYVRPPADGRETVTPTEEELRT